jgi:hypothetical protein
VAISHLLRIEIHATLQYTIKSLMLLSNTQNNRDTKNALSGPLWSNGFGPFRGSLFWRSLHKVKKLLQIGGEVQLGGGVPYSSLV